MGKDESIEIQIFERDYYAREKTTYKILYILVYIYYERVTNNKLQYNIIVL